MNSIRLPDYAELHCHSNFNFLTGASHPEELVERAVQRGYVALAITDECSVSGVVRAHEEAERQKFHLLIGSEMRLHETLEPPPETLSPVDETRVPGLRLVLLAQTKHGYGNLSQWISLARRRARKGRYLACCADLEGRAPNAAFLAGLPECLALLVPNVRQPSDEVLAQARWLADWFGDRAAIVLELLHRPGDDALQDTVRRASRMSGLPIAAAGDVLMHVRSRKPLQDVLTATRLATPVAQCGWHIEPNAEQHLRSRPRLAQLYDAEALACTVQLARRCTFRLTELKYEYPDEIVPAGATPTSHLRALTEAGMLRRYPPARHPQGPPPAVQAQVEHELALIEQMGYEPYFLTVADIVDWARHQEILCQGRGSAANSAVCYCLGVTEVDPARSSVLFERFISAERGEPPDIDIDFEHQRREEVIQYIYRKYGRHRAALTAVVTRYRPRSAVRDVGRALGIDLQRIDAVAKSQQWFDGSGIAPERLRENGFDPDSPMVRLWSELTHQLIGFPRHLSQHPGGFVIAREHIARLVPVENAAMDDRSVIQWDKDDIDAVGLLKVDILALGMLSALRRSLALIAWKQGAPFAIQDVPPKDTATFDMVCAADTVGVFQIESRAQMSMLPRLQPREYYDLVIEVAIVRPGPIQGGMVHPYLRRRSGEEDVSFPSDEIRQALSRTLGVPIFQEQVMQLAVLAADFTPGEADGLRRAMAAWKRRGGLGPYEARLVGRMVEKGYDRDFAEAIFKQIEGFGEYGFPESHAASFALLVYVSSWIKCHHPDAFLAALLNSQPMGFYAPAQLVRDAREHGVEVRPVDVRSSRWESSLERPVETADSGERVARSHLSDAVGATDAPQRCAVRLGLGRIHGLSQAAAERLVQARAEAPFVHVQDLAARAGLDGRDLGLLAAADALSGLAGHRHRAAWVVAGIDTRLPRLLRPTVGTAEPASTIEADLHVPGVADATRADYRALGLTLNRHPLALLRPRLAAWRVQTAAALRQYPHGRIARASGLVTHRQRPGTAHGTVFVTLEDETGSVNIIVWPKVAVAQRQPLLGATLLTVVGSWQREERGDQAVMHLVAGRIIDHSALLHGLTSRSRDFR